MKQAKWDYENDRQIIETGHKGFDEQTNLLTDGNILANTMAGRYIRGANNVAHWKKGESYPVGHLQEFDISYFDYFGIPKRIRTHVKSVLQDDSGWLCCLFHTNRNHKMVVHGWVLCSRDAELMDYWVTGPTYKSYNVVLEAIPYVTNKEEETHGMDV